jgi:hypothetical protein
MRQSAGALLEGKPNFCKFKYSSIRLQYPLRCACIFRTIADEQIVEGDNGVQLSHETFHTVVTITGAGNSLRRPQQSFETLDRCHYLGLRDGAHELRPGTLLGLDVTKTAEDSISVVINRQLAKTLSESTTPIQSPIHPHSRTFFESITWVTLGWRRFWHGSCIEQDTDMPDAQTKPSPVAFLFSDQGHGFFLAFLVFMTIFLPMVRLSRPERIAADLIFPLMIVSGATATIQQRFFLHIALALTVLEFTADLIVEFATARRRTRTRIAS